MPGGDKPGCSGSETPDEKTGESTTDIQSEQNEKSDLMSDPESHKSDLAPSPESESGSGMQTPDLTPDCSSSLQSKQKERSTGAEISSEDKETSDALTDSEISKSDPCAESDNGLQSPDLRPDSQTLTCEHIEPGQTEANKDVIPVNKSCPVVIGDIEPKFPALNLIPVEEIIEPEVVDPPVVEAEEVVPDDRISLTEPSEGSGGTNPSCVIDSICPPGSRSIGTAFGAYMFFTFIVVIALMVAIKIGISGPRSHKLSNETDKGPNETDKGPNETDEGPNEGDKLN